MPYRRPAIVLLAMLSACATRPSEVAVVSPPVVVAPSPPALPAGASAGMAVPGMLADGSFPTPNRGLTTAATVWHLRAGLNVAALACRADEAATVAGYNALLAAHKAELAAAETTYAAEFRARGADWRDRYDDAMTRLYNYYATPPAQTAFCAAAVRVLAEANSAPAGSLASFAAERLPEIDRAFTDFYRAYDAWCGGQRLVIASAASVAPPLPRVTIDRADLASDAVAGAR